MNLIQRQHRPLPLGGLARLLDALDRVPLYDGTYDAEAVAGRIDLGPAVECMSVERRLIVAIRGEPAWYPFLRMVFSTDSIVLKTFTS